jgi:hypothetical protein
LRKEGKEGSKEEGKVIKGGEREKRGRVRLKVRFKGGR